MTIADIRKEMTIDRCDRSCPPVRIEFFDFADSGLYLCIGGKGSGKHSRLLEFLAAEYKKFWLDVSMPDLLQEQNYPAAQAKNSQTFIDSDFNKNWQ